MAYCSRRYVDGLGFARGVSALAIVLGLAWTSPAAATTQAELVALIKAQSEQLKELKREVEELKRNRVAARSSSDARPLTKADEKTLLDRFTEKGRKPKSIRVPGTDVDIRFNGFAKLDYITRVNGQTSGAEDLFGTANIIVAGGALRGTDARTRVHARESRLGVELSRPTKYGDFRAFIEADFFGVGGNQILANSDTFRLRHAVAELGPFLGGQFWSTFMDPAAIPNTLDFQGSPGYTFIRQGQARYTHKFEDGFSLAVAAENPESRVIPRGASTAVSTRDTNVPDFVVRARWEQAWGSLQGAVLFRNISGGTGFGGDFGVGGTVHGKINVPFLGAKDNIVFQALYGQGITRYIQDAALGSGDGAINPFTNQLELLTAYGGYVGYQHWWLDNLRSNVLFSASRVEAPAFLPTNAYAGAFYASANLIWTPVPDFDLGVEIQWGQRENRDGRTGEATRIQSSAIARF